MATPKCPDTKCDSTTFELALIGTKSQSKKFNILHCAKCGCAIGIIEEYNSGSLLLLIAKKLGIKV